MRQRSETLVVNHQSPSAPKSVRRLRPALAAKYHFQPRTLMGDRLRKFKVHVVQEVFLCLPRAARGLGTRRPSYVLLTSPTCATTYQLMLSQAFVFPLL